MHFTGLSRFLTITVMDDRRIDDGPISYYGKTLQFSDFSWLVAFLEKLADCFTKPKLINNGVADNISQHFLFEWLFFAPSHSESFLILFVELFVKLILIKPVFFPNCLYSWI